MKRIALYAGSFDPFTRGHADIVARGLDLFDELIVAIGTSAWSRSPASTPMSPVSESSPTRG